MKNNKTIIYCALLSFVIHIGVIYLFNDSSIIENVKTIETTPNLEVNLEDTKSRDNKKVTPKIAHEDVLQKYIKKDDVGKFADKGANDKQNNNSINNGEVSVARPNYNYAPKPNYPIIAKKMGYEGLVNLKVRVLENGSVSEISILNSSGYNILDNAAKKAVARWSFFPASRNGKPFACWINIPVRFELE